MYKTSEMTGNIGRDVANIIVDPQIYTTQFLLLLCQSIHLTLQEVDGESVDEDAMSQIIEKLNHHSLIARDNPAVNKIRLKPSEALELYYNLLKQHNINQEEGLEGNKEICELLYATRIKELEDNLRSQESIFKEQVKYLQG